LSVARESSGCGLGFLFGCGLAEQEQLKKQIPSGDDNSKGQKQRRKERQKQRPDGWVTVYIPPIAKCAMDGAPLLSWLNECYYFGIS
jgi:hypothetical protein